MLLSSKIPALSNQELEDHKNVCSQIRNRNEKLIDLLMLDFEPNGRAGTMTLGQAEEFVTLVNEKTGRYPGVCSGQSYINEVMSGKTNSPLARCFLWIARYSSQPPKVPPAWETFTLWQYSDGSIGPEPHEVPGIGRCDRDKFNGDADGLKRLWNSE